MNAPREVAEAAHAAVEASRDALEKAEEAAEKAEETADFAEPWPPATGGPNRDEGLAAFDSDRDEGVGEGDF